jgi:DNA-directed RNA polymerase subunit omega
MQIVVQEIMQNKIFLDTSGNLAVASDASPDLETMMGDSGPSLDDL